MFGSAILDIAIGLIFVYLLLSLVCSAAKEMIEGLMRHRASDLENAMTDLLGKALADNVYAHGLITAMSKGTTKPSYIPAQTFALALMDTLSPATATAPGGAQNALTEAIPAATPMAPSPGLRVGAAAVAIPLTQQKALLSLIDSAGPDAVKLRENIETWFNGAMDRVTGIYKRRAQNWIFIIGAMIVCAINADTIAIADALSRDSTLRASLVAAATERVKTPLATQPAPATPGTPAPSPSQTNQQLQDIAKDISGISSLGIPLGWNKKPAKQPAKAGQPEEPEEAWYEQILGLLLTTLAVSLGAPFWFDTLNKAINIRAAMKPDKPAPAKP
jgi:hypothetical protein